MEGFSDVPLGLPATPDMDTRHGHPLLTILIGESRTVINRYTFLEAMNKAQAGAYVHNLSIPEHPYYQERFGWRPEQFPNAMKLGRETASLPISS